MVFLMLVTCFGYTGYRNAKLGRIQVHERITATSREILLQIKELLRAWALRSCTALWTAYELKASR
jgi:DNA polymerase elongation subunit (family B)